MKTALTIAGSDSGGGAGIQADLKTFSAHGVFGMSVITAVTAQNTTEVRAVQLIETDIITKQIEAIFDDIHVDVVKVGMLGSAEIVKIVADSLKRYSSPLIVVDPVMISKSGHHLLDEKAIGVLKTSLVPQASLVTPNLPEAETLTGIRIENKKDCYRACQMIYDMGCGAVLLKGGHFSGSPDDLFYDGENFCWMKGERFYTKNTHGTGCTLSSAIASNLAKGSTLKEAINQAKAYITEAIRHSFSLGKGHGPVHHFHPFFLAERDEVL